jgi:hypothetical protein
MMNERIDRLLVAAGAYFGGEGVVYDAFDPKKFAELIVRECAKFLDENSGSDQCNNVWYPEPEEMLQHFGVEE